MCEVAARQTFIKGQMNYSQETNIYTEISEKKCEIGAADGVNCVVASWGDLLTTIFSPHVPFSLSLSLLQKERERESLVSYLKPLYS